MLLASDMEEVEKIVARRQAVAHTLRIVYAPRAMGVALEPGELGNAFQEDVVTVAPFPTAVTDLFELLHHPEFRTPAQHTLTDLAIARRDTEFTEMVETAMAFQLQRLESI